MNFVIALNSLTRLIALFLAVSLIMPATPVAVAPAFSSRPDPLARTILQSQACIFPLLHQRSSFFSPLTAQVWLGMHLMAGIATGATDGGQMSVPGPNPAGLPPL